MKGIRPFLVLCLVVLATTLGALFFASVAEGEEPSRTLAILQSYKPHFRDLDEPADEREERLSGISSSIDGSTTDPKERAFLIMTAWNEARLARYVDLDEKRCREGIDGECDGGKAWSMWQLHDTDRKGSRDDAARMAIERFRKAGNSCRKSTGYYYGGISQYATGSFCEWKGAGARLAQMNAIHARLLYGTNNK